MGLFSKDIQSMDDLFLHGLQDIYYAEKQILRALPKMIDKATDASLKQGFEAHLAETEKQVQRLEQAFELLGKSARGIRCPAIDGILKEGDDLMGEIEGEDVMHVGIIAAAQAVERYEITRYNALIAWASELGREDCAILLKKNLAEEQATDAKLTGLADRRFNPTASPATKAATRKKPAPPKKSAARNTGAARKTRAARKRPAPKAAGAKRKTAKRKRA